MQTINTQQLINQLRTYEPPYEEPNQLMDEYRFITATQAWVIDVVQDLIKSKGQSLDQSLTMLYDLQKQMGFILDDLGQAKRFLIKEPLGNRYFLLQHNSARALRAAGAGRLDVPSGANIRGMPDHRCFLDFYNVLRQQRGVQVPLKVAVNNHPYIFLANPFPFGERHFIAASESHEPQFAPPAGKLENHCTRVVEDVVELATQAQSFYVLFNGVKAGASIPGHLHMHLLKKNRHLFPLQIAGMQAEEQQGAATVLTITEPFYPLTAFRIRGERDTLIRETVALVLRWHEILGKEATQNIIAISEPEGVTVYFVPRDKRFPSAPNFPGEIGSLECLGEFVFSGEADWARLQDGRIHFTSLRNILENVRPLESLV